MNVRTWIKNVVPRLVNNNCTKRDIEIILSFVTKKSRSWLMAFDETIISNEYLSELNNLILRRINGEPIAYLIGQREFWSLPLYVNQHTLIPRPDTEIVVEQALSILSKKQSYILDLGTGSGAIALAIASERSDCYITATDCVENAIELAKLNAKNLNICNVSFLVSNWFSKINFRKFNLIVSNPPYISSNDKHLEKGDIRFEPRIALISDKSGLSDLEKLIIQSHNWLVSGGWLILEHGWKQNKIVYQLMIENNYCAVTTVNDYGGNPRVTLGQKKINTHNC